MRAFSVLFRNHLYGLRTAVKELRQQPKLKIFVVSSFSVSWLLGLAWIFYEGFAFLYQRGGVAFYLVPRLFTLFFLGLGVMLMLSGAVTGFANLFQSPEVKRLLTWPVPTKELFYYALIKSTLMSSWAFFFVIVPMITSFGLYRGWGWLMMLWSILFSVPYVMLFSALGVLIMLLIIRWIPQGRTLLLLGFLSLVGGLYAMVHYAGNLRENQTDDMLVLVRFIPGLRLASFPLMPNSWMANGILCMSRGEFFKGGMYLLLLASTVAVLFMFLAQVGSWMYPATMRRLLSKARTEVGCASLVSRVLYKGFPGTPMVRAYGVKDLLLFLRDPAQWSQFLIFFGLMALYFVNLGSLGYSELGVVWSNLIAFLNMFSLSAVMSSLSARFVFPQMSMETRTLWMVGLAPHSLIRLMVVKFALSALVLAVVGSSLISLSNSMLDVSDTSRALSKVMMPCMAVALAGLSTGLGTVFMETGIKTPAQILSGYGGTLNLILSLVVVIFMVLAPGVLSHLIMDGKLTGTLAGRLYPLTILYMLILTGLAAGIPLMLGRRTLNTRDF